MKSNADTPPADDEALDHRLAQRLATLRAQTGWRLDELAARTGISRATLSRLERAESSATTQLLSRLCAAYGLTMSRLLAEVEVAPVRLLRPAQQPVWRDPANGFTRHMRSPPLAGFATELLEVSIQPGMRVAYGADDAPLPPAVVGLEHHLHLLAGALRLTLEGTAHELQPGDTLSYKAQGSAVFESTGAEPARYFLTLTTPR